MRLPEEIVVEEVLPTLRALLARELERRGLRQDEAARMLGLSQAAVSKYARRQVPLNPAIARDPRVRRAAREVAAGLAAEAMGPFEATARVRGLVLELENRGPVCRIHEAEVPALRGLGCDLCVAGAASAVAQEHDVLANLRLATRVLQRAPGMADLLPAVGSNLAMALPGAQGPHDVAAVPGRMYEADGAVKVPGPPEFGASRHVAEVVLGVMARFPESRAALNLRNGRDVQRAARGIGLRLARLPAQAEGRRARVAAALPAARPGALHHEGAFGVEPALYVLGADAVDAATRAARLRAAMRAPPRS